ncbi:MAG: choloylglycine hydrolase [Clostridia bacterium]|nr:choloylglycine hydrolase [Clostridia bacterium]
MCTALTYKSNSFYFGRNLDLDISYGEEVTVMPRNFILPLKALPDLESHYALIGMAKNHGGYPLFFDAANEKGLCMAGLNFPHNAHYRKEEKDRINLAAYEVIPYILGTCACVREVKDMADGLNITDTPFTENLPSSPLHWIISDKSGSLTLESTDDGLKLYENPWGVLTNNPPFSYHLMNMEHYAHLKESSTGRSLSVSADPRSFSLGTGSFGLPGDFSSVSRFVRAAFISQKVVKKETDEESVSLFFRMLSLLSIPEGCVMTGKGKSHFTRYSCCFDADKGIYYLSDYTDCQIRRYDIYSADLDSGELLIFGKENI